MQQSLENVISKLQKTYQLKVLELEKINEELESRRIATAIANFKDSDELSSYDIEKIKTFLTKSNSALNLDDISLAHTIVDLASPVVKNSKRYMEASQLLSRIKNEAISYIEAKEDLFLKQTQCDNMLQTMESLFNVLTNKVVVADEKLDVYIKLLENEIFNDDKYAVLVVVAALVMRNANLLANHERNDQLYVESTPISNYNLDEKQSEKRNFYAQFIKEKENLYESNQRGMVTNTYLKNIEVLIEKEKINFDEAKVMLNSDSNLYEYFIWHWMYKLVDKLERVTSSTEADNILNQLDRLKQRYDDFIERKKINELVKNKMKDTTTLIYQIDENLTWPFFNTNEVNDETLKLLNQLKGLKDVNNIPNLASLDNDIFILMGEQEFILFKRLPKNHALVLLSGKIEEMHEKLDNMLLTKLSNPNFLEEFKNIVTEHGIEYLNLIKKSEAIESNLFKDIN